LNTFFIVFPFIGKAPFRSRQRAAICLNADVEKRLS